MDCEPYEPPKINLSRYEKEAQQRAEILKKYHPAKLKAMCTSKRSFKTYEAAQNTAIKHALKHSGQTVASYLCPACGRWHLTTRPRGGTGKETS